MADQFDSDETYGEGAEIPIPESEMETPIPDWMKQGGDMSQQQQPQQSNKKKWIITAVILAAIASIVLGFWFFSGNQPEGAEFQIDLQTELIGTDSEVAVKPDKYWGKMSQEGRVQIWIDKDWKVLPTGLTHGENFTIIPIEEEKEKVSKPTPTPITRPQIGALSAIDPKSSDWLKPISSMLLACGIGFILSALIESLNGKEQDKADFIWTMSSVAIVLLFHHIPISFQTGMERRLAAGLVFVLALFVTLWRSLKGGLTPLATLFACIGLSGILGFDLGQFGIALGIAKTPMYTVPDAYRLLVNKSPGAWYSIASISLILISVGIQTAEVKKSLILPAGMIGVYLIGLRGYANCSPFYSLLLSSTILGGLLMIPWIRKGLEVNKDTALHSAFDCAGWFFLVLSSIFIFTGAV